MDNTNVYGVKFDQSYTTAHVLTIPKQGGMIGDAMLGERIFNLRLDQDGDLLYANFKEVRSYDRNSQMKTDLATNLGSSSAFAVDAENVYFADASTGTVFQVARGGTSPIVLAQGFKNTCTRTCTDGFADWPCATDGGQCDPHGIHRIEVDDSFVYFLDDALNTTGKIWRVAKFRDNK
jgi:hypothetical protein